MKTEIDDHGGVFRCLLRLREDAGNDVMSDREFLRHYADLESEPTGDAGWSLTPMKRAAAALSLAYDFQPAFTYEELLRDHRAGHAALVRINGGRSGLYSQGANDFRVTLLSAINESEMSLWCPMRNDQWDRLPPFPRHRWEELDALGVTLLETAPVPSSS
jgi:hypothetical protein